MATATRTFGTGNNSTLPNATAMAVKTSNSGDIQPIVLGYIDGSGDFQELVSVDGLLVQVGSGSVTASGSLALTGDTTTGLSLYQNLDLDNTKVAMKASAGTIYGWHITNDTTAPIYVKFWNVASGSVTVGTTAATMVLEVPGSSTEHRGVTVSIPAGIKFDTAITIACTTGVATASNSDPGANGCVITIWYI